MSGSLSGEAEPLLWTPSSNYGTEDIETESSIVNGTTDSTPKRQIGIVSVVFIIFNSLIGTGCDTIEILDKFTKANAEISIFATPSTILKFSGSVGLSL